jgi:uncharacterized repeat protein (TIGR01451 family)
VFAPRIALRVAALIVVAACALAPSLASAAERPFSLRYSNNVNGQITMAANTIMQCPTNTVDPLMNSGCLGAQAGTNARNNNSFDMQWLDVDSDPSTSTSSSANVVMPTGSRVLFAGLYWTGLNKKGEAITGANGFKAVPQMPADVAAIGTVKLKVPGSATYATVTAAGADVNTASIAVSGGYGAFADVTSLVNAGGAGTYTVANVQTGTGGNSYAGWSLVVAYSNPDEPLRNLSVFDGLKVVSGSQQIDIPLSGFKTPSSGAVNTTIGVVAAEGDAGATGDYLTLNEQLLTDAVHPANNTENSTIANRGQHVTTKNPDWRNQLGYDSSLFSADGFLGNGDTTAIFRAKTSGDTYAPQAITFATELFSPNVTLTKTSPAGQDFPGATKTYTITATNLGLADATDAILTDPMPPGFTRTSGPTVTSGTATAEWDGTNNQAVVYMGTGSASGVGGKLAPNDSVSFTITGTIGPAEPLGDVITNTATLAFVSPDLGLPISVVADDDTTITYPDPGISKTLLSSSGNQYRFQLLVTNDGTAATTGLVTVDDTIAGASGFAVNPEGTGWTCPVSPPATFTCTRSDVLAPGASYPPITVTATYPNGALITNTATLAHGSGGEPSDSASPSVLNNSSTVSAGQSPLATLILNKAALSGTISFGTLGGFRMEVRNNGPSPATGATLEDTLPAGLNYVSHTSTQGACTTAPGSAGTTIVSCALGTIPANESATVVIRARPDASLVGATATVVTNTATASSDVTPSPSTDTATLTIRSGADLELSKSANVATVAQGQPVTYTLGVTNNGPASASNVRVVDRLPAAIDPTTVTTSPALGSGCTLSGSTVTCVLGALANGASGTVTITGTTRNPPVAAADRQAVNKANVFSSTDDPDPSNNADEATVIVTDAADLQVNATGPGSIVAGGTGEVAFVTTNNGPSTAAGSSLVITIPSDLTPISAPAGCTIAGQTVTCALGDLASGASITTPVGVRAGEGLVQVNAVASADATSTTPDFDTRNNGDIAPFITGPVADLVVTKTAGASAVTAGGTVNWTLDIANIGPASSNGAVVTDTLPAGLTPMSISSSVPDACTIAGQVVTCQAGQIVPGGGYQALIVTQVNEDWAGAQITNSATLTPGGETDPNAANNTSSATVSVNPGATGADLQIRKVASAARVAPGGSLGYTITVTNLGGTVSTGATVTDTLPAGLTPSSARINGQACQVRGRIVTCPVPQLIIDASATVTITARVGRDRAGAALLNIATVSTGGQADPNPANNTARALSRVTTSARTRARLGIRTRVGPSIARPGQSVLVSATVRTLTGYPANTVRACLTIPKGLAYRASSGTRRGNVVCWTRSQVRNGSPVTVSYRAVARRAGTVTAVGTAAAGNAVRVSAPAALPIIRVTG